MEDRSDFDYFFREYYASLCAFVYSLIKDKEASRDIVSDAFEYVWKNFEKLEKSTCKSYLYLYVRNRSIDYIRHQDIKDSYGELYLKLEKCYSEITFHETDEKMMQIQKALDLLSPQTRHILEECYFHEKKYREVAEELGISVAAVQKHIVKALRFVREHVVK